MYVAEYLPDQDTAWWQQQDSDERWIQEQEMVDATKYAASESKDLQAKDFVGKNLKGKIASVSEVHFEARDDRPAQDKLRLMFQGKEKGLVLNASNTLILIEAYGSDTDKWIGHEIGLKTADYTAKGFGHGWVVQPLDIEPPDYEDSIPF